jgi:magnesium transporter
MLVNCVAYQDGRKLADIEKHEISSYLARPGCFVWVAMRDPTEEEMTEMQEEFDLHALAAEDARHGHQRPKIEEYGDSLFVVMNTIEVEGDDLRAGEVHVFAGRNYVLSVRHRTERGFQDVRARAEREPELLKYGSGYVLYALMDAIVDRYFPVLDAVEMELEKLEGRLFTPGASPRENIEALYYVKQKLTTMKHATSPLQENAGKLYGGRVPSMCSGLGDYFRDVYDHLVRTVDKVNQFSDMLSSVLAANLTQVGVRQNQDMRKIAAWAAILAVPTALAGVYGMNFDHMPELGWHLGYPAALATMVLVCILMYRKFRSIGWL